MESGLKGGVINDDGRFHVLEVQNGDCLIYILVAAVNFDAEQPW